MNKAQNPGALIIFDLDGVITTEQIYWECARLTLWELIHFRLQVATPYVPAAHDIQAREAILPDSLIYALKNRAINSNWDITFIASCALVTGLEDATSLGRTDVEGIFHALRTTAEHSSTWPQPLEALLTAAQDRRGADLIAFAGQFASSAIQAPADLFSPDGLWWQYLFDRFQRWYSGQLMGLWGAAPLREKPAIPIMALRETLQHLQDSGYILGVATGRPRDEALSPLKAFGVLDYFAPERIATYTEVIEAQEKSGQQSLGKPHPFTIHRALYPEANVDDLLHSKNGTTNHQALVVGDTASDALAAQAAGVACVGVLSGVAGKTVREQRHATLLDADCIAILDDITALPGWLNTR